MLQRLLYGLLLVGIAGFFLGAHPALADNGHRHKQPRHHYRQGHHHSPKHYSHRHRHPRHHYRQGHHHSPKHYSHHRHSGGYYRGPVYKHHGYSRHGYYGPYRPDPGVRIILPLPPLPHIVFSPYYR